MRLLAGIGVIIALLASAWPASGQTLSVRVIAQEAAVRQGPNAESAVIVTVGAGTLLTVNGQHGEWYQVTVPAPVGQERRGFISASVVEPFAREPGARGLTLPPPSPPSGAASNPTIAPGADWQGRYDRAMQRKRSGRTKALIGVPVTLAGVAMSYYGLYKAIKESDDPADSNDYWIYTVGGAGLVITGVVLTTSGQGQMRRAAEELLLLEAERTPVPRGAVFRHPLVEAGAVHASVIVGVGVERSAFVQLTW